MQSSKQTLSREELNELLHQLPEWALEDGKLVRFFAFPNFVEALAFVNRVAQLAEQAGHHPDIDIRYNRVKLALVSHDAGGITARDAEMARTSQRRPGRLRRLNCRANRRPAWPESYPSHLRPSRFAWYPRRGERYSLDGFSAVAGRCVAPAEPSCVTGLPARTIDRSCRLFLRRSATRSSQPAGGFGRHFRPLSRRARPVRFLWFCTPPAGRPVDSTVQPHPGSSGPAQPPIYFSAHTCR